MGAKSTRTDSIAQSADNLSSRGLSIIPIRSMTDKAPNLESWKPYTVAPADPETLRHWFTANGRPASPGMAIVCGAVSGGLTVIDFDTLPDGNTLYDEWENLIGACAPRLLARLPLVATPSGGVHVYLRCAVVEGNTKLAEGHKRETFIETRGEGGYIIAPPSPGYTLLDGDLADIPAVSPAERALLLNAARSLTQAQPPRPRDLAPGEVLPGDAYNAFATTATVVALLERHGWAVEGEAGDTTRLRRPGKRHGCSATVRDCDGVPVFYCFSANAPGLEPGKGYSPFGLLADLEYGGDYRAAARALAQEKGAPLLAKQAPVAVAAPATRPRPAMLNGNDLWDRTFKPLEWVVPDLLPFGLTLLAGSPKSGKSRLGLNIACAVAQGGRALGGVEVTRRPVLYLVMEDGYREVQRRLYQMHHSKPDLSWLTFADAWRPLAEDGLDDIAAFIDTHPDGAVVIDTYESLRAPGNTGQDAFRNDYGALKPLADLTKREGREFACLLIHHTNKRNSEDPYQTINGSQGLAAAPDVLAILQRRNDSDEVVLNVRGRALDGDKRLLLEFDRLTGCHTILGEMGEVGANRQQQDIVSYLRELGQPASPKEIGKAVGRENDKALLMQLGRMVASGVLLKNDWGRYTLHQEAGKGNNGNTSPVGACSYAVAGVAGSEDFPLPGVSAPPDEGTGDARGDMGCVTSVTFDTPDAEAGAEVGTEPADGPVPTAMQTIPCAGCGRQYTKAWAPSADGTVWCRRCGVEAPR